MVKVTFSFVFVSETHSISVCQAVTEQQLLFALQTSASAWKLFVADDFWFSTEPLMNPAKASVVFSSCTFFMSAPTWTEKWTVCQVLWLFFALLLEPSSAAALRISHDGPCISAGPISVDISAAQTGSGNEACQSHFLSAFSLSLFPSSSNAKRSPFCSLHQFFGINNFFLASSSFTCFASAIDL